MMDMQRGSDAGQQKWARVAMREHLTGGDEAELLEKVVLTCWLSCTFSDFGLLFHHPSLI